jgi:hypothetical protein
MRSMKGEVELNVPAEKAWEMYRDNEIISKINPEMLALAEYSEGDGSPGSLRLFRLGPGIFSLATSLLKISCHHINLPPLHFVSRSCKQLREGIHAEDREGRDWKVCHISRCWG